MKRKDKDNLRKEKLDGYNTWQSLLGKGEDSEEANIENAVTVKEAKRYHWVRLKRTFRHSDRVLVGLRGPPPGALAGLGPNLG